MASGQVSDKAVSQIHCRRLLDTAAAVLKCIAAARQVLVCLMAQKFQSSVISPAPTPRSPSGVRRGPS